MWSGSSISFSLLLLFALLGDFELLVFSLSPFFVLFRRRHLIPQALHKDPLPPGPRLQVGVLLDPQNSQILTCDAAREEVVVAGAGVDW